MRRVGVETLQFGVDTVYFLFFLKKSTNKQRPITLNYGNTLYITFYVFLANFFTEHV
jgi:hypothetical protein